MRGLLIVTVALVAIAALLRPIAPPAEAPRPAASDLGGVLARAQDRDALLDELTRVFAARPDPRAYCCGVASCTCTQLGDCILLWFSANCAELDGPDIQGGVCAKKSGASCTNQDCSCPD